MRGRNGTDKLCSWSQSQSGSPHLKASIVPHVAARIAGAAAVRKRRRRPGELRTGCGGAAENERQDKEGQGAPPSSGAAVPPPRLRHAGALDCEECSRPGPSVLRVAMGRRIRDRRRRVTAVHDEGWKALAHLSREEVACWMLILSDMANLAHAKVATCIAARGEVPTAAQWPSLIARHYGQLPSNHLLFLLWTVSDHSISDKR